MLSNLISKFTKSWKTEPPQNEQHSEPEQGTSYSQGKVINAGVLGTKIYFCNQNLRGLFMNRDVTKDFTGYDCTLVHENRNQLCAMS